MAKSISFPELESIGIQISVLLHLSEESMQASIPPLDDASALTKKVALELNQVRTSYNIPWDNYRKWIELLIGHLNVTIPPVSTLSSSISRIIAKQKKMKKNKKAQELEELLGETFLSNKEKVDKSTYNTTQRVSQSRSSDNQVLSTPKENQQDLELLRTNADLCKEIKDLQNLLRKEIIAKEQLHQKLKMFNLRNINKRIKRRDQIIISNKNTIRELKKQLSKNKKTTYSLDKKSERFRARVGYSKTKQQKQEDHILRMERDIEEFEMEVNGMKAEISHLKQEINDLQAERDDLIDKLKGSATIQLSHNKLPTKEHQQKYCPNIRQCCIQLLSLNVGIRNVEPIIRSVLHHLVGIEAADLPQYTALRNMLVEMKGIAYLQLIDELKNEENITLHSDGTTKFSHHYGSFQLSTSAKSLSLGLSDMASGTASATLEAFESLVNQLDMISESEGKKIVTKIKNTMSDRHIVEKNFNGLLEKYRASVLPEIIEGWDSLSPFERNQITVMNNFFCGMHLLIGMADVAASTLLQWERANFEDPRGAASLPRLNVQKGESGTVRFIRTACKAFQKHGSQQVSVHQYFNSFLSSKGILRNPLASFRGNRFNILFYDGGAVYYISDLILQFLTEVWQSPNLLLQAVLADAKVNEYQAGARALGLVSKLVTGPLWRITENSNISITDMTAYYRRLVEKLEIWANDASECLSGEATLYIDSPPVIDHIWDALIRPSENDALTQELLQLIFRSFVILLGRLLHDFLSEGPLSEPSDSLLEETKSVPKSNTVSERDFAKLDRYLLEKPNASTLALESLVLFSNNKTSEWLKQKTEKEQKAILEKAHAMVPEFRKCLKERRQTIIQERAQVLKKKQEALENARQKKMKEKEDLTENIIKYGLWQTREDILQHLKSFVTIGEKLKALKAQLDFRKKVLDQETPNTKHLFFMSRGHKKLSVEEVTEQLSQIVNFQIVDQQSTSATHIQSKGFHLFPGSKIRHRWEDEPGKFTWYEGNIVSVVPGTKHWYNVKYDEEDDILSLNLKEDYDNGDLVVVNL